MRVVSQKRRRKSPGVTGFDMFPSPPFLTFGTASFNHVRLLSLTLTKRNHSDITHQSLFTGLRGDVGKNNVV